MTLLLDSGRTAERTSSTYFTFRMTSVDRTAQIRMGIRGTARGRNLAAELAMERTRPKPDRRKRKGGRRATDQFSRDMSDDIETRKQLARLKTLLRQVGDVMQALTAKLRRP